MMALLPVLPAAKAQDHDFSNMEKEYPLLMQRYGDRLVYLVLQTGMVSGVVFLTQETQTVNQFFHALQPAAEDVPCITVSCNLSKSSGTRREPEKTDCAWAVLSDLMSADKLPFGLILQEATVIPLLLIHRLLLLHYDFFLYLDRGGRNLLKLEVKTELLCATLIFHI